MERFKMSKSLENLMAAFAGESQAFQKYSAFAVQADKEGYKQVAKLFRAAAAAEKVHASNHLRAAEKIMSTKENLQEAISGETYEFETMYPPMIEDAKAEGNKAAERSFTFANTVEQTHAKLYKAALDNLEDKTEADIYVCPICGETVIGSAPEKCPVCGAAGKAFMKID